MMIRSLTISILAIASVAASGNLAIAASSDTAPNYNAHPHATLTEDRLFTPVRLAGFEGRSFSGRTNTTDFPAVQSYPIALYCYTFAGPVCPMRVAVPPGSPCTCYYPDGALPGVAQ